MSIGADQGRHSRDQSGAGAGSPRSSFLGLRRGLEAAFSTSRDDSSRRPCRSISTGTPLSRGLDRARGRHSPEFRRRHLVGSIPASKSCDRHTSVGGHAPTDCRPSVAIAPPAGSAQRRPKVQMKMPLESVNSTIGNRRDLSSVQALCARTRPRLRPHAARQTTTRTAARMSIATPTAARYLHVGSNGMFGRDPRPLSDLTGAHRRADVSAPTRAHPFPGVGCDREAACARRYSP